MTNTPTPSEREALMSEDEREVREFIEATIKGERPLPEWGIKVQRCFDRLTAPSAQSPRELRDKISEILVRNNLRTDQVAIGELLELLHPRAKAEGMMSAEEGFDLATIELIGPEALAGDKLSFHEVAKRMYYRGLADALSSHQHSAPEWQDISTAPKTGRILLWYPCYKFPQIGWWNEAEKQFENEGELFCKDKVYIELTHWMHLPAPPDGK